MGVKVEPADSGRVTLQRAIELGFGVTPQRLLDQERDRVRHDGEDRERNAEGLTVPADSAQAGACDCRESRREVHLVLLLLLTLRARGVPVAGRSKVERST